MSFAGHSRPTIVGDSSADSGSYPPMWQRASAQRPLLLREVAPAEGRYEWRADAGENGGDASAECATGTSGGSGASPGSIGVPGAPSRTDLRSRASAEVLVSSPSGALDRGSDADLLDGASAESALSAPVGASEKGPYADLLVRASAESALSPPVGAPDARSEADLLDDLEEEIVVLSAHIHAATHRLLTLVAEFDRRRGWELAGHRSCAHWLAFRTGIDLGAAREKVRAARALEALPRTSACMARGELSFSQVRALSRVATPDNEADLLELARGCTIAQLERMVRAFRRGTPADEAEAERLRHEARTFSVFPDDDGMYLVRGRLTPEVGALLMRAIEAAGDALYRRKRWPAAVVEAAAEQGQVMENETEREAAQRRADAMGLLAERALAAGFAGPSAPVCGSRAERYQVVLHVEAATLRKGEEGKGVSHERWSEGEGGGGVSHERPTGPAACCDGSGRLGEGGAERVSHERPSGAAACCDGSGRPNEEGGKSVSHERPSGAEACWEGSRRLGEEGAERVSHERWSEAKGGKCMTGAAAATPGRTAHLEDGTRVSQETSRRLSCDTSVVRVAHGPDGSILDVGRRTRTIPPALRRALEVRDQGCRFPGCGSRFTDAHHVVHWADGGETSLSNCVLLCRHHHRLLHEEGWSMDWWGDGCPVFFDPRGGTHRDGRWAAPALDDDVVEALMEENRRRGIEPDPRGVGARWKREADIPDEVYFRALEGLG